jgi:glycosyltransferase involved in cell wall biosynthesis
MFSQPPFPPRGGSLGDGGVGGSIAVIIPTRNRPDRLRRCLEALGRAREETDFRAYVCDSSRDGLKQEVTDICSLFDFADLVNHSRIGASAARNVGTETCTEDLVVSVDDDVYVEPTAIAELVRVYRDGTGTRVVAGTVDWGHWSSRPLVMRWIGFAREARAEEEPELLVSALILYPRWLGLLCPWNERLWPADDLFASRLWRLAGAGLEFAPLARARHDQAHSQYPVANEADQIYVNLFDAIFVTRSFRRLISFELLGFAACTKKWVRSPASAWALLRAWLKGHVAFASDLGALRDAVGRARLARVAEDSSPRDANALT